MYTTDNVWDKRRADTVDYNEHYEWGDAAVDEIGQMESVLDALTV